MKGWYKVVEAFWNFKEAKYRLCKYHGCKHYADRSVVEKVAVNDNPLTGYKLVSKYYYHGVQIAEYDGNILTINCEGYLTQTTRDRLNAIVPTRFTVHLAQENKTYIAMYIYDRKEKKGYVFATDCFDYTDVKINVKSNEIINKNELKEIIYIEKLGRIKVDLTIDTNNIKYIKVKNKGLIRLTDLKTFKFISRRYACEDKVDIFEGVNNLKDIMNLVKKLNKDLYLEMLRI